MDTSVRIEAHDRAALERLLRYCARPPFSMERLRKAGNELVYRCAKQHSEPASDRRTDLREAEVDPGGGDARLRACRASRGVDVDASQRREVDHEAAVGDSAAGDVVPAAADHQVLQTPIDHPSRHNFFTDPYAAFLFFWSDYGPLVLIIPFAGASRLRRPLCALKRKNFSNWR